MINFDAIPSELKVAPHWVVWRAVVRDGRITKPPFRCDNPNVNASVTDPSSWGTFEQAKACYLANQSIVSGIGRVLVKGEKLFILELDDEGKVDEKDVEQRRVYAGQILTRMNTYKEISPSGKGLHIVGRGELPTKGVKNSRWQIECYDQERYFTFTGNVWGDCREITNQQEYINELFSRPNGTHGVNEDNAHRNKDTALPADHPLRPQGMGDVQLLNQCMDWDGSFRARWDAQEGCEPGEWSESFYVVVRLLERFTGDVGQIHRLVLDSPLVRLAPPSGAGESRVRKAARTFAETLQRARQANDEHFYFVAHGARQAENLRVTKMQQMQEQLEVMQAQEEQLGGYSFGSKQLLDTFPEIATEARTLTRPPGIVGEFVAATEEGMHTPYTKFAIPATLSVLAGILARQYKLPDGAGPILNFVLIAPSGSGKTQTMNAWKKFLEHALKNMGDDGKNRIVSGQTSSIQGIFDDFQDKPSCVWFVEECGAQLAAMSNPKSYVDLQLRDSFNSIFDASFVGNKIGLPKSRANRNANIEPIDNLSVSTYWTTTNSKFEISTKDALDGYMSRIVIINHRGDAGDPVREEYVKTKLPDHLNEALQWRLHHAKMFDDYCDRSRDKFGNVKYVNIRDVDDFNWEMRQRVHRISKAAANELIPEYYVAVTRVPMVAMRIAVILAIMDNPEHPCVSIDHYRWAFGYVLQNIVSLLSDFDLGRAGDRMKDHFSVIMEIIKREMKSGECRKLGGVPRGVVSDLARKRKPFFNQNNFKNAGAVVKETLDLMISEEILTVNNISAAGSGVGKPRMLLKPNFEHSAWKT